MMQNVKRMFVSCLVVAALSMFCIPAGLMAANDPGAAGQEMKTTTETAPTGKEKAVEKKQATKETTAKNKKAEMKAEKAKKKAEEKAEKAKKKEEIKAAKKIKKEEKVEKSETTPPAAK